MPETEALGDQKELSLAALDQWWYLKTGTLPNADKGRATSRALFDMARKTVPGLWDVRENGIVEPAD
jgi:hypothetical protein